MGWNLVAEALRLLANQIGVVLRLSAGPFLVLTIALWVMFAALGVNLPMVIVSMALMRPSPQVTMALLGGSVLLIGTLAWVAVGWHRAVLAGERPGLLPALSPPRTGGYALRMLGLSLLLVPAVLVADLVLSQVAGMVGIPPLPPFGRVVPVALQTLTQFLVFRLGLGLPGWALDKPLSFSRSWALTAPHQGDLLTAAGVLALVSLVPSAALDLAPFAGTSRLVLTALLFWALSFLGLAALATVYRRVVPPGN